MCDDSQDVAVNVVPSSLPSCLPPLSSDVTKSKLPEISDSIDDHIEPNNCFADINPHQGDSNVADNEEDDIHVAGVTSPQSVHCVSIDSNCFKCDFCAESKCSHEDVANTCTLCIDKDEPKEQKYEDASNFEITNLNHDCSDKSTHLFRYKDQTVQSECSTSTDGTLRNSEESCESDVPCVHTDRRKKRKSKSVEIIMGNKQSGGKQGRDEGEHEGRTKCCEIPKRKVKERNNRSNRTSRHDDLAFDSAEVYPFDGRIISEHELHEPVELEPFEIVETDDIKFVPGAGTSDVIKSVSEPKFSTIPEEPIQGAEYASTSNENQYLSMKTPFYVEKGNRLIEPGTSTAHSTFEFKQVKTKTKLVKMTPDPFDHNYENVQLASDADGVSGNNDRKVSNSSSKSSSSSSSKDISRNNSKDAKQKPARKGKAKASDKSDNATSASVNSETTNTSAGDIKRKQPKSKKEPAIRDSEIDRKIDSVLMLTQTMFSRTKPDKTEEQDKSKGSTQDVPTIKYENVGVVAKMESTGIKIVHKEVPIKNSKEGCEKKKDSMSKCTDDNNCENVNATRAVAESSKQKNYPQLSSDILEISESGTLIIKSLADLPSEKPEMESDESSISITNEKDSDNDDTDQTDKKTPYDTIDTFTEQKSMKVPYANLDECQNNAEDNVTVDKLNEKGIKELSKPIVDLEEVPPPSPSAMNALAEVEEEEEEDEEDDDTFNENKRKSTEIEEFTENVCKRLSQLLILEGHKEEESEDDANNIDVDSDEKKYADHIYETIDGKSKVNGDNMELQSELYKDTDSMVLDDTLKLSTRRESTGTLKRTSGDSETYQRRERTDSISSESSDDMPSYFDPSHHSLSHTDAEVFSSEPDSYVHNSVHVDYVPGDKISKKTTFEGGSYDNVVLENEDNLVSEGVKTFDLDLINDAPSTNRTEDLLDRTPTSEAHTNLTALTELANVEVDTPLQYQTSGRQSVTCTESDLDISEHRDDLSTDSMLADDEAEETMEILFTKTYTEPVEGAEVFLSCTVVNSAYKDEHKKSETWLSDEALEYFEANASEVMSTAFLKAKKEMKDIQICLQSLRQQMEHFHSDHDDISLPDLPVDSLSPDYFGIPHRKAITD